MDTKPQMIPVPDGFPVAWDDPSEESLFWTHDRMHWPEPVTPLQFEVSCALDDGFATAFEAYHVPMAESRSKRINGYLYNAKVPMRLSPEELEARGARTEQAMGEAMGRLMQTWDDHWLPEILEIIEPWETTDLRALSDDELLTHGRNVFEGVSRLWGIHFLVVLPAYIAMSEFDELYRSLFESDDQFGAWRLLQGIPNKTVEVGLELWKVSRGAAADPEVRRVIEDTDPVNLESALGSTEAGRAFLTELRAFLDVYGRRADKWTLDTPPWIEDPAPIFAQLRDLVAKPDDEDPALEIERLAMEREREVADARERLEGYPEAARQGFEFLLKAAQEGVALSEDHGFYIDFRSMIQVRRIAMEWGRRLAASGSIDRAKDVFLLTRTEAEDALSSPPDLRTLVAERRAEMERAAALAPPPALGTPEPEGPDNPFTRFFRKFFGGPPQTDGPPVEGEVRGSSGSPGMATGVARVIGSITEAHRLGPAEVLVAETTAPPWTPLFAKAAAVVTDTGGILSHCAVVAREYAIPAVVGCGNATKAIRDGDTVEVDGEAGLVRIVVRAG